MPHHSAISSSLHIRTAGANDTAPIIELLKSSLGDSTIPKSQALWTWKHLENPFGQSFVLVAEEDNQIIGLRAFMQWHFQRRNKVFRAIRAVDTATHPAHQGKGIFKKLTMHLMEFCKAEGVHFVFNTPNDQSKPGYLKMGWIEQGRLDIKIKLLHPFTISRRLMLKSKKPVLKPPVTLQRWTHEVFDLVDYYAPDRDNISTVLSPQYISWRYANNPLFRYNYFTDYNSFLLICRVKDHAFGRELRITETILLQGNTDYHDINKWLKQEVLQFCSANKVDFVSVSGQQYKLHHRCLKFMGILPVMPTGPVVTLRDLNMKSDFLRLAKKKYWNYSIGDLELF